MKHEKFHYKSLEEVREKEAELGVEFPLSENVAILKEPFTLAGHRVANRIAIQPMEGSDSTVEGRPGEYTKKRYERFAKSGAGLIWLEAVAIAQEGRATPGQLYITPKTLDSFKALVEEIRETAWKEHHNQPVIIMQATHSGRYSKPHGYPEPIIAYNNPLFEKDSPIPQENIITDERLRELEEQYGLVTRMAQEAGFDGIDIKCCHRYLNCELLSAYTRPGVYGGSFENGTRFFRNAFANAKSVAEGNFIVTSRMNIYDGFPYPYGFGVAEGKGTEPDMTEPIQLIGKLRELGMELVDITIGNPYVNPHVNRPYDMGGYEPPEHPFEGVARMYQCTKQIAEAYPDLAIISSGPSYLRQFSPNLAAGAVEQGYCTMVGFGRESFAYPEFVQDLFEKGSMDPAKCCITCGKCAELLRASMPAGCVIRNPEYTKVYQELQKKR